MSQPIPQTSMRVMPHHTEAEKSLLGSVLLRQDALNQILEMGVSAEDLYVPAHQEIFRAMGDLFSRGQPIDGVTLEAELRTQGKAGQTGGLDYLYELSHCVPTAENVGHYAQLVREASMLRQLIQRTSDIMARAYAVRGDVGEFIDEAEQRIFDLSQSSARSSYRPVKPIVKEVFDSLARRMERRQAVTGVPTGFADLDRLTCGLQPSELVILAARPSVGKTSFAIGLALQAALECELPVLFCSLEMSAEAVAERMLCATARLDSGRVRGGFMDRDDWTRITGAAGKVSRAPVYIDDQAASTVNEIRARARRFRSDRRLFPPDQDRLGLIIVDYLQLVRPSVRRAEQSREQEVSSVSQALKALAKEVKLPVVALSQLRRGVEDREDQRPRLSDLRESGAIEQDADVVAFIHRNPKAQDESTVKLIVAKQRNGPVGECELVFLRQYTRFESAARGDAGGGDDF